MTRVITAAELNRSTLARQFLLERASPGSAPEAIIERVGGLQAQEPASPYIALWTRMAQFDASSLDQAFHERRVVKASLMRATLHAVTPGDYRRLAPTMQTAMRHGDRLDTQPQFPRARLTDLAEAFATEPRTNAEMTDHLARIHPGFDGVDAWAWVRRSGPFLRAPSRSIAWSYGRRPTWVAARAWLGDEPVDRATSLAHLVRRYLGAFGPATIADIAAWSRLAVRVIREGIAALGEDVLMDHTDEHGRALFDLVGAPVVPADSPAPPRYLPMWDSVLLAYADRTRLIDDDHRRVVVGVNGDTLPTFLVDGRVAGLWWAEMDPDGRTRIVREPFIRITPTVERELDREGKRLAAFVEPHEPAVYARYRTSRARRPHPGVR